MRKRRWTVVFVPHGAEPSRIVEVSLNLLKLGAAAALVVLLLAVLVGFAAANRGFAVRGDVAMARENVALAAEIQSLHDRLGGLTDTLRQISQRDARIRVLANLEPIDPQVMAAGIGGPVAPGPSPAVTGPLANRTTDVRIDLNALIRRANLLAHSFEEAADSLASHKERLAATPSIMPTRGWLSSAFAAMRSHPLLHVARPHEGIDVSAPMGTPIEAPGGGTVVKTGWETGYGNIVELDHGYGIRTKFAHASKVLVRVGQRVTRGQRIALVGNSGLATGPHLHYEVHMNGRAIDPLKYVLPDDVVTD